MKREVRDEIAKARTAGCTWQETAERATKVAGEAIAPSVCHRYWDLRIEQVGSEALKDAESSRAFAKEFAAAGFENMEEATLNALASEVFAVMRERDKDARRKALRGLLGAQAEMIAARAKEKSVELEEKKVRLAEEKFEQLKARVEKETSDAAKKLGKGKGLTIADINRIRETTFGLGPIEQRAPTGNRV